VLLRLLASRVPGCRRWYHLHLCTCAPLVAALQDQLEQQGKKQALPQHHAEAEQSLHDWFLMAAHCQVPLTRMHWSPCQRHMQHSRPHLNYIHALQPIRFSSTPGTPVLSRAPTAHGEVHPALALAMPAHLAPDTCLLECPTVHLGVAYQLHPPVPCLASLTHQGCQCPPHPSRSISSRFPPCSWPFPPLP
jgi:hypothetical protein